MRAVVTEIRETSAAVLCEDGQIRLIPAQNFHKGQEITLSTGRRRVRRPLMWAACVAVLCAMATTSVYAVCERRRPAGGRAGVRERTGKRQHHGLLARQRQGRGPARDAREARKRARGRWGGAPGAAHPDRTARERKDGRYMTHSEQSASCGAPEGLGRFAYKNHAQFG